MKRIVCLKGDGIGPEIMDSAIKVLEAVSDNFKYTLVYEDFDGVAIDNHRVPFTDKLKAELKTCDAASLA